jgi:plastocyanin
VKRSLFLGFVLCLAGAACSGNQTAVEQVTTTLASPSPSPSPSPTVPVQLDGPVNNTGVKDFSGVGTNIAVEFQLNDFAFTPTFIKVLPGTSVNFSLDNMGQSEHTFTIDSLKVDHELEAGGQQEGQFQLPGEGVTVFYCRYHVGQGMQGAFYFQEGDSVVASPSPDSAGGTTASGGSSTRSRTAATTRRATSSGGAAPAPAAQNREGDLVIPDLEIGGVEQGGSTAAKAPVPLDAAGAAKNQPGTQQNNTSPNVTKGSDAQDGGTGQQSQSGGQGAAGQPGSAGEPGNEDD